tara:strand:- start:289 stop:1158 length:870 start_codon:yes stop_codon:yes gene_type:complete
MKCPEGQYFCNDAQKCKPIPKGHVVKKSGMLVKEVAPPTKKHERMIKHIKNSYKKKGGLSDEEKSIAYATAWKDFNKEEVSRRHKPSAVAKKKKLEKLLIDKEVKDIQKESVQNGKVDLTLKTDVNNVLKQQNKDYDRGLLAKVNKDGSYDVAYWYDKYKAYPVEVEIDGKSIKKDAKIIHIKYHPELKKKNKEEAKAAMKEHTYQEMIDAGWEMTGEGIWWPPQNETIEEKISFPTFKKKATERKPEKAMDAGAKARRKLKRKEHAKYVSGSEDNVPDDIRDHKEYIT